MTISITFDVEPDIHTKEYKGITQGLETILKSLDNYQIKATFFTTCDCIEKYPSIFKKLKSQGHEISLHAYRHERFDDLTQKEKENQIKKSIACFKKHLNQKPLGFRAPQHSIDDKTLDLLEKNNFEYDSSFTPLNLLQLLFFPKRFSLWFTGFFSPSHVYKIRKDLYEIPTTSFFIPFVSLVFRAFPKFLLKLYFNFLNSYNRRIVIYFHSWDFIDVQGRIAKKWPKERMIENLDQLLKYIRKNNKGKFVRMIDLIK